MVLLASLIGAIGKFDRFRGRMGLRVLRVRNSHGFFSPTPYSRACLQSATTQQDLLMPNHRHRSATVNIHMISLKANIFCSLAAALPRLQFWAIVGRIRQKTDIEPTQSKLAYRYWQIA